MNRRHGMRRIALAIAPLLLVLGSPRAQAQQVPPPELIVRGLDLLRTSGANAALDVWLKGFPENSAGARAQLLGGLEQIQGVTGPVSGYDFIGSADWGPH